MEAKTTKYPDGRSSLPPEKRKSERVFFRVTPEEKELLQEIGDNTYWRNLIVWFAKACKEEERRILYGDGSEQEPVGILKLDEIQRGDNGKKETT